MAAGKEYVCCKGGARNENLLKRWRIRYLLSCYNDSVGIWGSGLAGFMYTSLTEELLSKDSGSFVYQKAGD